MKKIRVPTFRGLFSRAGKKLSPQKVRTLIFFTAFPLHVWDSVFSELKFLDSSLRLYARARVLDIASWHVMAL